VPSAPHSARLVLVSPVLCIFFNVTSFSDGIEMLLGLREVGAERERFGGEGERESESVCC
jgi:hypothetical protein